MLLNANLEKKVLIWRWMMQSTDVDDAASTGYGNCKEVTARIA